MKSNNRRRSYHGKNRKNQNQRPEPDVIMRGLLPLLDGHDDTVTIPRDEYNSLVGGMSLLDVIFRMAADGKANYEIGDFVSMMNKAVSGKEE